MMFARIVFCDLAFCRLYTVFYGFYRFFTRFWYAFAELRVTRSRTAEDEIYTGEDEVLHMKLHKDDPTPRVHCNLDLCTIALKSATNQEPLHFRVTNARLLFNLFCKD